MKTGLRVTCKTHTHTHTCTLAHVLSLSGCAFLTFASLELDEVVDTESEHEDDVYDEGKCEPEEVVVVSVSDAVVHPGVQ